MGLLTQFKDSYSNAEAAKGGNTDSVPDGKYQARIDRAEIKATRDGGAPMIAYQLVVMAGEHANRRVFKNSVVSDKSLPMIKKELITIGYTGELDALEEPNGCAVLLDRIVEIQVKTNQKDGKTYNNVYINRLLDGTAAASAAGSDDAPF